MNESDFSKRVIELLTLAREPEATEETCAELNQMLRTDAKAREIASEYLADEAALTSELKLEKIAGAFSGESVGLPMSISNGLREKVVPFPFMRWVVGLVATLTLLAAGWFALRPVANGPIMKVVELDGSLRWTGDGGQETYELTAAMALGGGTIETLTSESWAELEFLDGSRVTVSGQSILTVSDFGQKQLRLRQGNISADVAKQPEGRPLLVHTPTAQATVLGTQFNLSAEDSSTQVTVNEGEVSVMRLADNKVQNISANYQVVASLEQRDVFQATRRREHETSWKSAMQDDEVVYGEWKAAALGLPSRAIAKPMLWNPKPNEKFVLYISVLSVNSGDAPPVLLEEGAKFRVHGRVKKPGKIYFGFSGNHRKGGFAGKYSNEHLVKGASEFDGSFEAEVPLSAFKREEISFPSSANNLEITHWWIVSFDPDAELELLSVELIAADSSQSLALN